jgi:hypothetical protein
MREQGGKMVSGNTEDREQAVRMVAGNTGDERTGSKDGRWQHRK